MSEGSEEAQARVGELVDGRYEIVEYVEAGGVGQIFRAQDRRLEFRQVAIKLLKKEMPADQVSRFKREALLTGGLSSPHVCKTSDFGTLADGQAFLVMEWLKGQNLADLLIREKRLPVDQAVRIADGVLAGLEAAHNAGVVHRDLKPENIFIQQEPGLRDHVKLLDFGFARVFAADALDVTGEERVVVGTVTYMAPEQLRGRHTDHRADLFSVAALLYRMLTGEMPYETKGPDAAMVSAAAFRALRLDKPPNRLVDLEEFADYPLLSEILDDALSSQPEDRPTSAGEMRIALATAMGRTGLPMEVSEPGAEAGVWGKPATGAHNIQVMLEQEPAPEPAALKAPAPKPWGYVLAYALVILGAVGYFAWRALR